jgi:transcriptional regulator with XRE-family HTH domain
MIGTLPKRLRYLREKRGLAQKYVAEKIRVKNNTLSGYESGRREPDNQTLNKLADFYGVTSDYLIGRSDEPTLTGKEDKALTEEAKEYLKILESMPPEKREPLREKILAYAEGLADANKDD